MDLLTVVRMIPAGVVPSRSFFSLSHRLVGRRWKKKERKMIMISSLNSDSVCLLLWVFSTCLFTLDRIGPVYFRCVCFSCCYFLRLHETFDAPIIGLTCVCVFFFFSILFLTCCDIQCDSTVRARGLRLLLHNKMLQLTCTRPTLFSPFKSTNTHITT